MPRKKPKGKLIVSRKTIHRTYQDLVMLAVSNPRLSPVLYAEMKEIVKKTRVRPRKSLKRFFCNKCGLLLSFVGRRVHRARPVIRCQCGHIAR